MCRPEVAKSFLHGHELRLGSVDFQYAAGAGPAGVPMHPALSATQVPLDVVQQRGCSSLGEVANPPPDRSSIAAAILHIDWSAAKIPRARVAGKSR